MGKITAEQFLNATQKNEERVTEYALGCDGSSGGCDCIGLIIGALRLASLQWSGTHGSNWAARNAVDDLKKIGNVNDLIPGMVVFKARELGDSRFALPEKYKGSGDLRDYYHVGIVTRANPLQIDHCTSGQGCMTWKSCKWIPSDHGGIKFDTKLGAWQYAGKLKQVIYQEVEPMEALYQAEVTAENGHPVMLRAKPSTNAKVIEKIPVGVVVDVIEETSNDWAKLSDKGVTGFMMRKFLTPTISDSGDGESVSIERGGLVAMKALLVPLIQDAQRLLETVELALNGGGVG